MTATAILRRRWVRALGLTGAVAAGYFLGITSDRVGAQPPAGTASPPPDKRVVAYIYGNIPVTREELGDFLIARGGHEKLELLVNKRIIEIEAAKRNIVVTPTEVQAALEEDLRSMGISQADFVKQILPRYGKTLFEWTEDVIRPRLLLGKMCADRIQVTDEEVQKLFENRHGERRQAKIIIWPRDDLKRAQRQWEEARKGDAEFDRVARSQLDPNLAASAGLVAPLGRYPDAEDDTPTKVLWGLKVGEMSHLFETPAGIMCIKCVAIVPPDADVKLEGRLKEQLYRDVHEKKLNAEIPKYFAELKKVAQPNLLLKGPPSPKEFRDGVMQGLQQIGATGPAAATPPPPVPNPNPNPTPTPNPKPASNPNPR